MEDSHLALRLYDDLKRSGLDVWRYEADSKKGRHFQDEYIEQLRTSDYFCLVDSPAARLSNYVAEEIFEGLKNFEFRNKFFVCLKGEDGDWRNEIVVVPGLPPIDLERLNKINYVQFFDGSKKDIFEEDNRYRIAIEKVIQAFGVDHIPWSPYPWLYDLRTEFFNSVAEIPLTNKNVLLNKFHDANYFWVNGNLKQAEWELENLVRLCDQLPLISPQILLGAVFFDQHKLEEAKEIYTLITSRFTEDPRGWFGLGLSCYLLSDYEQALNYFNHTLFLVEKSTWSNSHQKAKPRVIQSIARTQIQLGRYAEASACIKNLDSQYQDLLETKIIKILLASRLDNKSRVVDLYQSLHYDNQNNSEYQKAMLADLEANLARYFHKIGDSIEALKHCEKSVSLQPQKISYWGNLALLCHWGKTLHRKKKIAIRQGLKLVPVQDEDYYFQGLLHYLNNDFQKAGINFDKSKTLQYPDYKKLVDPK